MKSQSQRRSFHLPAETVEQLQFVQQRYGLENLSQSLRLAVGYCGCESVFRVHRCQECVGLVVVVR